MNSRDLVQKRLAFLVDCVGEVRRLGRPDLLRTDVVQ